MNLPKLLLLTAVPLFPILAPRPSSTTLEQDPVAQASPFVVRMEYFVDGGGEWIAKNEDRKAGDAQPDVFVYRFAWGLDKHIARLAILGRFDDGREVQYWETVCAWDPVRETVVMHQFGLGGAILTGDETRADEMIVHELRGLDGEGDELHFRDESVVLDKDSFRSTTLFPDGEGWKKVQSMTWKRSKKTGRR